MVEPASDENVHFYEIIPTLQDMTSYAVAIESWRTFIRNEDPLRGMMYRPNEIEPRIFFDDNDQSRVKTVLDQFPLPSWIRRLVEKHLGHVKAEFNEWCIHYDFGVFDERGEILAADLLFCHWLPNGKIDYERTAWNMLRSNPRMNLEDKFQIVCKYCFENEINNFPFALLTDNYINVVTDATSKHNLMFYWVCHLRNEMHEIPNDADESAQAFMMTQYEETYSWSAIEYLWDRMNAQAQLSTLEDILSESAVHQKHFFFKIKQVQKVHMFREMPVDVMGNFWIRRGEEHFAVQAWMFIRNIIQDDEFKYMWKFFARNMSDDEEKMSWLSEIWHHCPDRLKKLALEPAIMDIIVNKIHAANFRRRPCKNIDFLARYLLYASPELRKTIIFERAYPLVWIIDPSVFQTLIDLCLRDAEDVVRFTNHVLKLASIRNGLIKQLQNTTFERFDRFLDFFCPNPTTRYEYCSEILEIFIVRYVTLRQDKTRIDEIYEFIDRNIRATSRDRASEFKGRLAMSFEHFCWQLLSSVDDKTKMTKLVTRALNAEELDKFKSDALNRVQYLYQWNKFDRDFIDAIISWCCNDDDEKMAEFKRNLPIDYIFDRFWNRLKRNSVLLSDADYATIRQVFEPLDRCLKWYFGNNSVVMWYKIGRVFGYRETGRSMFLLWNDETNDAFTKNSLQWFFQGHRSVIDIFKSLYKNEDISKMI